jgi:hypothetical protein
MFVIILVAVSADDVDTLSSPIPLKLPFTCTCTTVRHSHVKTRVQHKREGLYSTTRVFWKPIDGDLCTNMFPQFDGRKTEALFSWSARVSRGSKSGKGRWVCCSCSSGERPGWKLGVAAARERCTSTSPTLTICTRLHLITSANAPNCATLPLNPR